MELTNAERVRAVISQELGVALDLVASDALIGRDLGADSHDRQQLTLALETEFNIEIPDAEGQQLQTVRQIVDYIEGQRAGYGHGV